MEDKVEVRCQREDPKGWVDFAKTINSYIDQGYKISESTNRSDCISLTPYMKRVVMVKVAEEESDKSPTEDKAKVVYSEEVHLAENKKNLPFVDKRLQALENLSKKDELLGFAEECDIEIPESAKVPAQIKKIIKDSLENKPE